MLDPLEVVVLERTADVHREALFAEALAQFRGALTDDYLKKEQIK